jgi:Ca2+-binding RTX toxin-like protein
MAKGNKPVPITGDETDNELHGTDRNDYSISGYGGNDILYGHGGDDQLYGHEGEDTLYGGSGDDRLMGGEGEETDYLFGDDGNDVLFGGYGDDFLHGGAGNDDLWGGPGTDLLTGGTGADTFKWARGHADANLLDLDPAVDSITDFESGIDKIDISHFDADETTPFTRTRKGEPGNDAFTYVTETDGITPGHLTLTYDPLTGYTTLNAYTDTEDGADFTLLIFGQVNPGTDIVF